MKKLYPILILVLLTSCGSSNNFNKKKYLNLKSHAPQEEMIIDQCNIETNTNDFDYRAENAIIESFDIEDDFETVENISEVDDIFLTNEEEKEVGETTKTTYKQSSNIEPLSTSNDLEETTNYSTKENDKVKNKTGLGLLIIGIIMLVSSPGLAVLTIAVAFSTNLLYLATTLLLISTISFFVLGIIFIVIGASLRKKWKRPNP